MYYSVLFICIVFRPTVQVNITEKHIRMYINTYMHIYYKIRGYIMNIF